jgi:hypothetical protein
VRSEARKGPNGGKIREGCTAAEYTLCVNPLNSWDGGRSAACWSTGLFGGMIQENFMDQVLNRLSPSLSRAMAVPMYRGVS